MLPISWRYVIPLRPHTWTPLDLGSLGANILVCCPAVASQILKFRELPNFENVQVWLESSLYALIRAYYVMRSYEKCQDLK